MILDRYLLKEIRGPFVGVSLVLIIIFITYSLTRFLTDATSGLLSVREVVFITAMRGLIALEVLLPIALYVAVILGFGRLYSDSEMDAFRGAGVSEKRLLRPVLALALILAIVIAGLTTLARPWAYSKIYALKAVAEASSEIDRIKAGRFHSFDDGNQTVLIGEIAANGKDLKRVFISRRQEDGLEVIAAEAGLFLSYANVAAHQLILSNTDIFRKAEDGSSYMGKLNTFTIWLKVQAPESLGYDPKAEPTGTLSRAADPEGRAEFQWRLSTPVSTLLLAALAVPLSRSRSRQGRFARVLLAFLVYASYFGMLALSRTWVEQQVYQTIWWAPALLASFVACLYMPWSRWLRS